MFDWLGDLLAGLGTALSDSIMHMGSAVTTTIFDSILQWWYRMIFGAAADFFTLMNSMGAEIFDLSWIRATLHLFHLLGWSLFAAGTVVAVFDIAMEYQNGRGNLTATVLNILKGFFACGLITTVPVQLYQFCISLQNTLSHDLAGLAATPYTGLAEQCKLLLQAAFLIPPDTNAGLLKLLTLIAFLYCVVKVFFQNIKRGGILMIQMAVGSLYMFSVPRGYTDGFVQWCKQVVATCLTAFLQTSLLYLGMMTFHTHMMMGLGLMLAAEEVPRIAMQFGLDSASRPNIGSVLYSGNMAINLAQTVRKL